MSAADTAASIECFCPVRTSELSHLKNARKASEWLVAKEYELNGAPLDRSYATLPATSAGAIAAASGASAAGR